MMDEPTRGIDVGAKYEIYELIINMAKQGKTIIVVSSEMPEILGITNRIGVMSNGRLSGIVNTKAVSYTHLDVYKRQSLSRGKSIITVRDELEHVRNYLMIQHMRYKNKFTYTVEAEDEVLDLASLKLVLQPLVENAIYHGMEFMDGDGEIRIRAWRQDKDLFMSVSDNGLGMTRGQVKRLFGDTDHMPSGRGSGIGVKNVHQRIRLYFGNDYGLEIQSEPDEGTTVTAHLPAIPYEEVKKEGSYVK